MFACYFGKRGAHFYEILFIVTALLTWRSRRNATKNSMTQFVPFWKDLSLISLLFWFAGLLYSMRNRTWARQSSNPQVHRWDIAIHSCTSRPVRFGKHTVWPCAYVSFHILFPCPWFLRKVTLLKYIRELVCLGLIQFILPMPVFKWVWRVTFIDGDSAFRKPNIRRLFLRQYDNLSGMRSRIQNTKKPMAPTYQSLRILKWCVDCRSKRVD